MRKQPGARGSTRIWPRLVLLSLAAVVSAAVFWWMPAPGNDVDLSGRQVYVVHGVGASPDDHWFPWLKRKLEASGARVTVLAMPNTATPDPAEWLRFLQQTVHADEHSFFVAHSLGCIALLNYLQTLPSSSKIGGLVLVSGFSAPLPLLPELDAFTRQPPDFSRIAPLTPRRVMIASRNDRLVPYGLSVDLGRQLGSQLITVDEGGHFLASDGFTELPAAYDALVSMMRR